MRPLAKLAGPGNTYHECQITQEASKVNSLFFYLVSPRERIIAVSYSIQKPTGIRVLYDELQESVKLTMSQIVLLLRWRLRLGFQSLWIWKSMPA